MGLLEDMVEDILLRLAVDDLTRFKIVCKSWYSLISSHPFAKTHLKQQKNHNSSDANKELGHVRIAMPTYWKVPNERSFIYNQWNIVGSCNGLVCFSQVPTAPLILVNNPWTREIRKLPMPPLLTEKIFPMFFGFGYDSSTDDYKLVMGTSNPTANPIQTLFQVLSLKSNTWKPMVGVFKYQISYYRPGLLFNGALHWLAFDYNASEKKRVILSYDLSREEFTVINTDPVDSQQYATVDSFLGIVEDQLCIFFCDHRDSDLPSTNIWVTRSCKGERYWEKLPDNYETKHQVVHYMKNLEFNSAMKIRMSFFADDNKCLSRAWYNIKSPLFVPSLVSPYAGRPRHAKNNKTSVKSRSVKVFLEGLPTLAEPNICMYFAKGIGGQQLQGSIRRFIINASEKRIREIEAVYRREVGETQNFYFHEEGNREIKEMVTKIEGDTVCAEGVKNNEKEK